MSTFRPLPPKRPAQPPPSPRRRGTVRMWDDDKGFGFIEPDNPGPDVFLHIKALADRATRPTVGAVVTFRQGTDEKGRPRALDARLESGARPSRSLAAAGVAVAVFLGGLGLAAGLGDVPAWIPIAYLVMSSLTFAAYAWDKLHAERDGRRTPENTLHFLELLGGWPGALLAQQCLRHKTSKTSYLVVFWLVALAHIGLWVWLAVGRPGW